ncbi:hypothetical protein MLPF_3208 [Mycobacterium lepromatosis]|nr:amidohydrolase family protein [Mycobacterium lepromatosis]UKN43077.1 hypothetical protein MLPF_3208 [Mycobacterium lepromatosis]
MPKDTSAKGVLGDVDCEHIDTIVLLYPSLGLCILSFEDRDFASRLARFYNQWIADCCAPTKGWLRGVGVIWMEHGQVVIDITRNAKELGIAATLVPPVLNARNLEHPDLGPFYAAIVERGMPLSMHGAPSVHLPQIGVDRFKNYIQVPCISFSFDQMTAIAALVSNGVVERHTQLRVVFMEVGAGWPHSSSIACTSITRSGEIGFERGWRHDPRDYLAEGNI